MSDAAIGPIGAASDGAVGFRHLARARAVLLTTFKRDGTPVATPVWLAERGGRLYVTTVATSGKPTGPAVEARARLLGPEETAAATGCSTASSA